MTFECRGRTVDARLVYPEEIDLKAPVEQRLLSLAPKRFDGKKRLVDRKAPTREAGVDDPAFDEPSAEDFAPGWREAQQRT